MLTLEKDKRMKRKLVNKDLIIELLQSYGIQISMDGIGRCRDNIIVGRIWRTLKYEWIFLRDYQTYKGLEKGLVESTAMALKKKCHISICGMDS